LLGVTHVQKARFVTGEITCRSYQDGGEAQVATRHPARVAMCRICHANATPTMQIVEAMHASAGNVRNSEVCTTIDVESSGSSRNVPRHTSALGTARAVKVTVGRCACSAPKIFLKRAANAKHAAQAHRLPRAVCS